MVKEQSKKLQISITNSMNGEGSSDLIPGLPDDITLGPIMTRLPWYTRSKLVILSSAWRATLEKRGNHFAYHSKEDAMRNSVIIYSHAPFGGKRLVLKILQEGTVRDLPLPKNIPCTSLFKILLTDERIYYLILDGEGKNVCHVKMIDLTNGLLKWENLPPLALAERKLIDFMYATTGPDGNSTCIYMHSLIPSPYNHLSVYLMPSLNTTKSCFSVQGKNCSVWQLFHGEEEAQWHKISSDSLLGALQNMQDDEPKPPLFLAIYDQHSSWRYLYKRLTACDYSLAKLEEYTSSGLKYLLVFRDDYSGESLKGLHCFLPCSDELKFFRLSLQGGMEIRNVTESSSFRNFWRDYFCVRDEYDLTALEFSTDLSQELRGWEWQFNLPYTDRDRERGLDFNISQQGYMHIYVRADL